MERIAATLCPAAHSRSSTRLRVKTANQSASGAVMTTSQMSSLTLFSSFLQLADEVVRLLFIASDGTPSCDDLSVVAESDPSARHVLSMGMQDEVHRAFGADRTVYRGVP